jgi:D-glycero-alpha-D-manno-heptose-7-phosphate kinase
MLFRLGDSRSSSDIQKKLVHGIKNSKDNNKSFAKMIDLSINMKEALLKGKVKTFGDMLHESWLLKQAMNKGVTNALVEECYNTARELGALGGKLLGAGSSGYLLIYASPLYQKKIKNALAEKSVLQEMFKFSKGGLEVWSTKR